MNHDEAAALCQREADGWNAHDPARVAACFAADGVEQDAGGEAFTGHDGIVARVMMFLEAFPDMRLDVQSVSVEGNRITECWRASGTNTGRLGGMDPTGKSVAVDGCSIIDVGDDGLIRTETDYWNEAQMLRQLGLMPEATTAG